MNKKHLKIFKNLLNEFISQDILIQWEKSIGSVNKTIEELIELSKSTILQLDGALTDDFSKIQLKFYEDVLHLLNGKSKDSTPLNFQPDLLNLGQKIESIFKEIPSRYKEEQNPERYSILPNDTRLTKVLKLLKKSVYWISTIPQKLYNWLRSLLKKKTVEIRFRPHTIRLQLLIRYHFEYLFALELNNYRNIVNGQIAKTINGAWEYINSELKRMSNQKEVKHSINEENSNNIFSQLKKYQNQIDGLIDRIQPELSKIVEDQIQNLENDCLIAGTIEYPNWRLKAGYIKNLTTKVDRQWNTHNRGWDNTFYAIFDDCESDAKIFVVKNKIIQNVNQLGNLQGADNYRFQDEFNQINEVFHESLMKLDNAEMNPKRALLDSKYNITKHLNREIIPHLTNKINEKNLSGLINSLEKNIETYTKDLSNDHVVVKSENYLRPLETKELETISIIDIISFELLPKLKTTFANLKNTLFTKLAAINESIIDLDKIAVFAIESAITNIEDPEANENESIGIARKGIERAKNKLSQIKIDLNDLYQGQYEQILIKVDEFNHQLESYTINENALEIKISIVKNKAILHSKAIRQATYNKLKSTIKSSWNSLYDILKYGISKLLFVKNKFFLTAPEPVLSREASDFLSYSNKKIESLPILYKNLYKIQPISDNDMFVGRENELIKLKNAYDNWKTGNYSSTALIGEKWGGMTSLISNFIANNQFGFKIYRISFADRIYDESQFIRMIGKEIEIDNLNNLSDLINALNGLPSRRIIIIEDIQKMFLRSVSGFGGLKSLFKILVDTNKNIFWLISCTIYAWNYLKEAIFIDDYFSNIIIMEKLSEDQVIEIIRKRNRISGLSIVFESDESKVNGKKLKGLSAEEQQLLLFKKYFKELTDFSESNISLALLFWLLSTKEITDNQLIIGYFQKPDLSFVKVMNMDRILVLMSLILHDGITESELSKVNNITLEEAKLKLIMLLEDGLVYIQNERYLVNPLIYRNVIKLLNSKNLIQ